VLAAAGVAQVCAAQGQVHVVDDDLGPGVDFATIQAAVNASSDGDLILVRSGGYSTFTIDGKRLTVTADAGASAFVNLRAFAQNLAPTDSVVLRGLGHDSTPAYSDFGFRFTNCAGPIWVEDSKFRTSPGVACVDAQSSLSIALLRCTTEQTSGFPLFSAPLGCVQASDSGVQIFDCDFEGLISDSPGCGFAPTIHGVWASGASSLFASGSAFKGGDVAGCQDSLFGFCSGLPAGSGLALDNAASAVTLDCALVGGQSMGSTCCSPPGFTCGPGPQGAPVTLGLGASHLVLEEVSRSFEVGSPIRAGQTAQLTISGYPGDLVVMLYSYRQEHAYVPGTGTLLVPLALGTETGIVILGTMGGTGVLQTAVPFGLFPPELEFFELFLQPAFINSQLVVILGGGSVLDVLNQAF
jgi:hypothetical protein